MNLYVPDYYPAFRCIAERCRHTCCAGWEIDIGGESPRQGERGAHVGLEYATPHPSAARCGSLKGCHL